MTVDARRGRSLFRLALGAAFAAGLSATPAVALAAGLSLALSVGTGYRASPNSGRINTNIMLAPGVSIIDDILRLEVGFVGDLADVEASEYDLQIRPMAVVQLPALPIYGRLIVGATNLVNGPRAFAFGAAAGIRLGLGDTASVFGEVGYVPRAVSGSAFENIVEGRAGVGLGF